jgi:DNA-binding NarL/FixJ family response regulator
VASLDTLVEALRTISAGGTVLDPEVVAQLLVARRRTDPLSALSAREREVLALMAEGRSNAAIAERLVVTGGAVEKHISNIFAKINLPDLGSDNRRVLAVLAWLRAR